MLFYNPTRFFSALISPWVILQKGMTKIQEIGRKAATTAPKKRSYHPLGKPEENFFYVFKKKKEKKTGGGKRKKANSVRFSYHKVPRKTRLLSNQAQIALMETLNCSIISTAASLKLHSPVVSFHGSPPARLKQNRIPRGVVRAHTHKKEKKTPLRWPFQLGMD